MIGRAIERTIGQPLLDPDVGWRVHRRVHRQIHGLAHGCTIATMYRASRLPAPWKRVGPASTYRRQSPARRWKSVPLDRRARPRASGDDVRVRQSRMRRDDTEAPAGIRTSTSSPRSPGAGGRTRPGVDSRFRDPSTPPARLRAQVRRPRLGFGHGAGASTCMRCSSLPSMAAVGLSSDLVRAATAWPGRFPCARPARRATIRARRAAALSAAAPIRRSDVVIVVRRGWVVIRGGSVI